MPRALLARLVPAPPHTGTSSILRAGKGRRGTSDLIRMAELAKGMGCQVRLTANGILLSQGASCELVRLGMDLIAVSLTGGTPSTHGALRKGAEKAFSLEDADPTDFGLIGQAEVRATSLGVPFLAYPPAVVDDVVACEALPTSTAVVAADVGVFPRVYLSLPVDPIPRLFRATLHEVPHRPFGSLAATDPRTAWESAGFRAFRRTFELRLGLADHPAVQRVLGQEIS